MQTERGVNRYFRIAARTAAGLLLFLLTIAAAGLSFLLQDTGRTFEQTLHVTKMPAGDTTQTQPFPLGVDPRAETITEDPNVAAYLEVHFANDFKRTHRVAWLNDLYERIAYLPWYQSLASPASRVLVINPGDRKEEVAYTFAKILGWSNADKTHFLELVTAEPFPLQEGTLYPGKYVVTSDATPEDVARQIQQAFTENVLARYPHTISDVVSLEQALTVASLIEREANSFVDMQIVSGVIWRRLFSDMKLQLDATLQYARGSRSWEPKWWPVPVPNDKFIDSPYNTYKYSGLPPTPIASPSAAAIIAALNPTNSDCLFYFHSRGKLYCSTTYQEHVGKLKNLYGRGQ